MKRILFLLIFTISIPSKSESLYNSTKHTSPLFVIVNEQDSLKELQNLYVGKIWTNKYRNINGDQFLFTNFFLPGTVSSKGKTYKNLLIKYDVNSDEILIPIDNNEIIQLNKEIVDSFSIKYENKLYRFINIQADTIEGLEEFRGYINVVLKEESSLYIKYKKEILSSFKNNVDVEFIQSQKIFLSTHNNVFPIISKKNLYEILGFDIDQIKNFVKKNKIKVSIKEPESFIQIIRYCDNLNSK